jgi:hypothetical protein
VLSCTSACVSTIDVLQTSPVLYKKLLCPVVVGVRCDYKGEVTATP